MWKIHFCILWLVPLLLSNGIKIGGYNHVQQLLRNKFDFTKLFEITKILTNNLNKVIDINFYPTEKTERSKIENGKKHSTQR